MQKQGIAPYINHGVSVFSSSTRFRKGNYNDLTEIRKLLLHPEWGTTSLDARTLKEALEGEQSFLLSISDGEIGNWDSEKSKIKTLIENNYFAHLQLGGSEDDGDSKPAFCRDLEAWNMPVFYIKNGENKIN